MLVAWLQVPRELELACIHVANDDENTTMERGQLSKKSTQKWKILKFARNIDRLHMDVSGGFFQPLGAE